MKMLAVYVATLVVFTGVDFVWLGRMGDSFYRPAMGGPGDGRLSPRPGGRVLFALCARLVFFAVSPALAAQSWKMAAAYGLALGLVGYGVYDLTNQATLKTGR